MHIPALSPTSLVLELTAIRSANKQMVLAGELISATVENLIDLNAQTQAPPAIPAGAVPAGTHIDTVA